MNTVVAWMEAAIHLGEGFKNNLPQVEKTFQQHEVLEAKLPAVQSMMARLELAPDEPKQEAELAKCAQFLRSYEQFTVKLLWQTVQSCLISIEARSAENSHWTDVSNEVQKELRDHKPAAFIAKSHDELLTKIYGLLND